MHNKTPHISTGRLEKNVLGGNQRPTQKCRPLKIGTPGIEPGTSRNHPVTLPMSYIPTRTAVTVPYPGPGTLQFKVYALQT